MAYATRRSYAGAAPACTLTNAITSSDTTAALTGDVTNWNNTANGGFYMVIDPGLSTEEKVLVGSRSSTALSSMTRGVDGTTASAHAAGATCYPVFTAIDADQANKVASTLTTKGDLLATDGSVLNRLAVGTNDYVLKADSSATNGVAWGQVAAAGIASDAVTTAKILDSNVTAAKLASDSVTTAKILDANVTTAKIADANVTGAKLANLSVSTKTANYTLVAADRNTRVVMNSSGSTSITVNNSVFSAGDVVWIHNIGSGTCTVTAGTATVTTSGSLALAQWGGGTLYFTSASAAIFFPAGGISYGTATGGSSSSISVSGVNYTLLSFTSTSTLTVTKDGLFDVLVVGGGSSGETQWAGNGRPGAGGGGAAGYLQTTLYLTTATTYTVTIGGGGAAPSVQMSINSGTQSALNASSATGQPIGLAVGSACGKGSAPVWSGNNAASNAQMGGTAGGTVGSGDGGGGGGLGAAGSGRAGGSGKDFSSFLGSTVYLGGGGSGRDSGGSSSTGGIGGGGGGSPGTGTANAGTNTGGGGMGGADLGAGNGGSGIVYVRFKS